MCFKINFKFINHYSFSVTDEDDIRCIVDPVYGDTIEVERPTTHTRKDNKISSTSHCWLSCHRSTCCTSIFAENVFILCTFDEDFTFELMHQTRDNFWLPILIFVSSALVHLTQKILLRFWIRHVIVYSNSNTFHRFSQKNIKSRILFH